MIRQVGWYVVGLMTFVPNQWCKFQQHKVQLINDAKFSCAVQFNIESGCLQRLSNRPVSFTTLPLACYALYKTTSCLISCTVLETFSTSSLVDIWTTQATYIWSLQVYLPFVKVTGGPTRQLQVILDTSALCVCCLMPRWTTTALILSKAPHHATPARN